MKHLLTAFLRSGGGRFDAALLAWCPQAWHLYSVWLKREAWCSDNCDAFSRTRIQMGTSMWAEALAFECFKACWHGAEAPVRSMGAHIAACGALNFTFLQL